MKKGIILKTLIFVLTAVMAAGIAAGCNLFPSEDNIVAPALKTPKPVEYQFYSVVKGDIIKGSSGTGSMTSIYYYKHAFPTSGGIIKAVYVSLGQYVNKGDLLVETDNSSLELDFLEASIEYTQAKATFDNMVAEYNKGNIDQTAFRIEQLKYQYIEAKYTNLKNAYENTKLVAQVSGKVVYVY